MNTLKTTMSKIAQIEQPERTDLAKHEVELALVDDINNLTSQVIKITSEFENQIKMFEKSKNDLKNIIKGRTQQSIDLRTKISEAQKMAKDLGLKFDDKKQQSVLDTYYKATDLIDKLLA